MRPILVVCCLLTASTCLAQANLATATGSSRQPGDPVHLVSALHHKNDALKQASLENLSGKIIASYRIGWASVSADKTSMHEGQWLNVKDGLQPGDTTEVPAQGVEIDHDARVMMFFVAEVIYSDGSHWEADADKLIHEANKLDGM